MCLDIYKKPLVHMCFSEVWKPTEDMKIRLEFFFANTLPHISFLISIRIFFHGHWRLRGQQGKWGDHLLFHSTTSTCSRTFRHLFATLHVRWLSHIFNHTTCIYQTATWWDLPPYQITIWLIDDVTLVFLFVYVMIWFDFFLQQFETGNWWTQTCIDYDPCITSELTSQVWGLKRKILCT